MYQDLLVSLIKIANTTSPYNIIENQKALGVIEQCQMITTNFLTETTPSENEYYEIIKNIPSVIFCINYKAEEKEQFAKSLSAFLNPNIEYISKYKGTILEDYICTLINLAWVKKHSHFFTENLFEKVIEKNTKNTLAYGLVMATAKYFLKNASNKSSMVIKMHEFFKQNENIFVPDQLATIMYPYTTREVYDHFEESINCKNELKFGYKRGSKQVKSSITVNEMFDRFLTDSEIEQITNTTIKECSDKPYKLHDTLKRFQERIPEALVRVIVKEICLNTYNKNSSSSYYKEIPQWIIDKYAEDALSISQWTFVYFSDTKKLELAKKIDFEKYLGLLAYHPEPESICNELWIQAIEKNEISHNSIPYHLTKGTKSLSVDEWFEMIKRTNGGNNKIFKGLVKHHPHIIDDDLLEKVSTLKGSIAASSKIVSSYLASKQFNKSMDKFMLQALTVAKTGDAKKIATTISKLTSLNMASKENLEKIISTALNHQ